VLPQTETQVALLADDDRGQAQAEALRRLGSRATGTEGPRPFVINPLPGEIEFTEAYEQVPVALRRPLWALLGVGGDDGEAVGVDLAATSSFFVGGEAGTGRSNTLASMAVSLLAGGTHLVVLTPRHSPLQALARYPQVRLLNGLDPSAEAVEAALEEVPGPVVVVIDDADLLGSPACDMALRDVAAAGRDRGRAIIYAGPNEALSMAMASWIGVARRSRRGLLLGPRNVADGEIIGARLTSSQVRMAMPVGRAFTAGLSGTAAAVQVPLTVLRES
jgi:S-DNA-T family DNA segregation ATPase FtsK/SpoIIIE